MREAIGTNANIMHVVDKDGNAKPLVEFIIYMSDKGLARYGDSVVNVETFDTVKFGIQPEVARVLIKNLEEVIESAEDQACKLNAMCVQTEGQ